MPVKGPDGLVHAVGRHETDIHFGRTRCVLTFSRDPRHVPTGTIGLFTAAKPPITCFACLAAESEP